MPLRDVVLEGVRPVEVEALSRLASNPADRVDSGVLRRLAAKGWVDTYGDSAILTLTGRALLDAR